MVLSMDVRRPPPSRHHQSQTSPKPTLAALGLGAGFLASALSLKLALTCRMGREGRQQVGGAGWGAGEDPLRLAAGLDVCWGRPGPGLGDACGGLGIRLGGQPSSHTESASRQQCRVTEAKHEATQANKLDKFG